jgi:hypothetical protein
MRQGNLWKPLGPKAGDKCALPTAKKIMTLARKSLTKPPEMRRMEINKYTQFIYNTRVKV